MSRKLSAVQNRAKYLIDPDPLDSRALWWRLREELALNPDFPMTVDTRRLGGLACGGDWFVHAGWAVMTALAPAVSRGVIWMLVKPSSDSQVVYSAPE